MCGIIGYVGERAADAVHPEQGCGGSSTAATTRPASRPSSTATSRCVAPSASSTTSRTLLREQPLTGTLGIGHTRWATHGRPSEQNAHPHRAGKVVVIHNGIIENYLELRGALEARGPELRLGDRHRGHLAPDRRARAAGLDLARRHARGDRAARGLVLDRRHVEREPDRLVAAKSATPDRHRRSATARTSSPRTSRRSSSTRATSSSSRTARWPR